MEEIYVTVNAYKSNLTIKDPNLPDSSHNPFQQDTSNNKCFSN
jgi:hypothetical protein